MFSLGAGLAARVAPYAIAVFALAAIGASVTAYVLSARLEAAEAREREAASERDNALAANKQLAEDAKRHEDAARGHLQELAKLRGQYEKAVQQVLAVKDDGCLDRALPRDVVDGVLNNATGDRGSGAPADPGVPRAAPGP